MAEGGREEVLVGRKCVDGRQKELVNVQLRKKLLRRESEVA